MVQRHLLGRGLAFRKGRIGWLFQPTINLPFVPYPQLKSKLATYFACEHSSDLFGEVDRFGIGAHF